MHPGSGKRREIFCAFVWLGVSDGFVRRVWIILGLLAWVTLGAVTGWAEVYPMADGTRMEGSPVSANERGIVLRLPDGTFSDRIPWERFSQEALREFAKNPKFRRFAEVYVFEEEQTTRAARPAVPKPQPVEGKLSRPEQPAIWAGLLGSPVGWLILLALYAANLYAAYEIAIYRARPVALVCGLAAVIPVIPQAVFLALPTQIPREEEGVATEAAAAGGAAGAAPAIGAGLHLARDTEGPATAKPVEPTVFKRGEYAFNRRFFETKFSGFFGMVRRDKSSVLIIKTGRHQYVVNRITRITTNDMHVEVQRGAAVEEIPLSFSDIQEVELRPAGGH